MSKKYRRGTIYRRGGVYWLKYMVDGSMTYQSLETSSLKEADGKRIEIMRPIMAAEKADVLAVMVNRLKEAETESAKIDDELHPPLTLTQAWAAYMEAENRPHKAGASTLVHYEGHLSALTAWLKEHHPTAVYLRDVTAEDAAGFIRHLVKQHYSGNRINKIAQFLKTLFRVLAKPGRMTANPFDEIARREHIANTKRPFTIEELKTIIERAQGELKTLFMLGTFTGLRLADAATLRWDETDLARAIIRRIPRKTKRTGTAVIIGIPAILGEHLAALPRKGAFIMPQTAAAYDRDQSALCKEIQSHLEQCGIQTAQPGTGFEKVTGKDGKTTWQHTGKRAVVVAGFHSLRHSFVSLHAQEGTPQAVLQKLVGHGNPIMTEHYTHISDATARKSADAFPHIMGAEPVKALPGPRMIEAEKVRHLADQLTSKNATKIRKELLALTKANESNSCETEK